MARRKGVTKSRNSGGRKITEAVDAPKSDKKLKDDPGGTNCNDMDQQTKLMSSPNHSGNIKVEHRNSIDSQLQQSHGNLINMTNSHEISSTKSFNSDKTSARAAVTNNSDSENNCETKHSSTLSSRSGSVNSNNNNNNNNNNNFNNNNQNDTTVTSPDVLKYLHKKFKRVASTTSEDISVHRTVGNSYGYTESQIQDGHNHNSTALLNGFSRLSPASSSSSSSSVDNKTSLNLIDADQRRSPYNNEGQNYTSNSFRNHSSHSANQIKLPLTIHNQDGFENNISSIKSEAAVTLSSLNKVLNRVNDDVIKNHVIVKSEAGSSPPTAIPAVVTIVPGKIAQQQQTHHSQTLHQQSQKQLQPQQQQQQQQRSQQRELDQSFSGRYVCPYCNLNCTKPSVLQKHIRAHTNERPYPCETCGFAFKTKSNYFKHCRSKVHSLRIKHGEPQPDDDASLGSNQDPDPERSNSSSDVMSRTASPMEERTSSPATQSQLALQQQQNLKYDKPYKPKFHNAAAFYIKEEVLQRQLQQERQPTQQQQSHLQQQQHSLHLLSQTVEQSQMQHRPEHQSQHLLQHHQPHFVPAQQIMNNSQYHVPQAFYVQTQTQQQHQNNEVQDQNAAQYHPQGFRSRSNSNYGSIYQYQTNNATTYPVDTSNSSRESMKSSYVATGGTQSSSVVSSSGLPLNAESLHEHISKIISRNEAIVENKELLLKKKYPKMSGKAKSSSVDTICDSANSKLAFALTNRQQSHNPHQINSREEAALPNNRGRNSQSPVVQITNMSGSVTPVPLIRSSPQIQTVAQQQVQAAFSPQHQSESVQAATGSQPLNLTKIGEQQQPQTSLAVPSTSSPKQRVSNESENINIGPNKNPRSIIKDLLLNSRGLGVPNGEGDDAVYTCPLCKMDFRSAEDLKVHTSRCTPSSPAGSPSRKYMRSELNNPNSLEKLAQSSLLRLSKNPLSLVKLAWSQLKTKPSNLVLNQLNIVTSNANAASTVAAATTTTSTSSSPAPNQNNTSCNINNVASIAITNTAQKLIDAPLPSPGPLLGKTPLIDPYNNSERRSEDVIITRVHDEDKNYDRNMSPKRLRFDNYTAHTLNAANSVLPLSVPSFAETQSTITQTQTPSKSFTMCGGEVKLLDKKEERMRRFMSSGGCIIPISECPDVETSPKMILTPLLSGGCFTEVSPKSGKETSNAPSATPKIMIPVTPLTPNQHGSLLNQGLTLPPPHFQFPPINSITAYNPLTLPPVSMGTITPSSVLHGDKLIPFVPGIPGPNTLAPPPLPIASQKQVVDGIISRNVSPSRRSNSSPNTGAMPPTGIPSIHDAIVVSPLQIASARSVLPRTVLRVEPENVPVPIKSPRTFVQSLPPPETAVTPRKTFNFTRIADNISPRKTVMERNLKSPDREVKYFNFENLISKSEIIIRSVPQQIQNQPQIVVAHPTPPPPAQSVQAQLTQQLSQAQLTQLHVDVVPVSTSASSTKESSETEVPESRDKPRLKFLRPTSLPLKPGTFTPKRHHGITPTTNTLPLISPETPRPSKAYIQQYLNGNAYTYLGLKCSTKMFYCTINCPQPSYIANVHQLSMYSKWQTCAENNPHPLGFKPKIVMALYDSRQRSYTFSVANIKSPCATVHSQATVMTPFENNRGQFYHHQVKLIPAPTENSGEKGEKSNTSGLLVGGYESNEDYTYIRGRGRGRYVCMECGIRCKKPSMLKKHIRTHTDVRPYTCKHCSFSFKTKGNLTKHMQSKTHYKKCIELGIHPGPMPSDAEFMDNDCDMDQQSTTSGGAGGGTSSIPEESDSDDFSDGGDDENESSDTDESKSRLQEHEAARCLLSLSMTPPSNCVSPHMFQQKPQSQLGSSEGGISQRTVYDDGPQSQTPQRRIISFTSPKPPFDYQKQEQYYSDPIIPKGREEKFDETSMKPIDLTKPRHMEAQRVNEIVGEYSSDSGLLKSLVSITDKIRKSTSESPDGSNKLDENIHLQAYLTEQALKYSKIKQCQMNKVLNVTTSVLSCLTPTIEADKGIFTFSKMSTCVTTTCDSVVSTKVSISAPIVSTVVQDFRKKTDDVEVKKKEEIVTSKQPEIIESELKSISMDKTSLTQIAGSIEDASKDSSNPGNLKLPVVASTGGAKSVASEYLKMTSAELLKSRNGKPDDSEESCSDQEVGAVENNSNVKTPSDFSGILARTVIVGEDGFKSTTNEVQPVFPRVPISDDGRPVCTICSKTFQKQHQMVLHMNIHYMERKFKCEPCAVSFRTQGHLQKHERSEAHKNKVMMTSTFGVPTTSNPRPFECPDCKVAFRIHGHLAKHLRSKTHVQKLECLQKLPFGTYAEIERAGISLTEIDTTDCDNSLASLKVLAQKLIEKDPSKMNTYTTPSCMEMNSSGALSQESSSEDSPDMQQNDSSENVVSALAATSNTSIQPSNTIGSGVKRKYDSISNSNETATSSIANSNCSNSNSDNQEQQELGLEKRVRTTSET